MGVSTDSILFYGILLSDDENYKMNDIGDINSYIADKLGVKCPDCDYSTNKKVHQEYWHKKSELLKELKIEIGTHSHTDDPMYFLYSRKITAYRGYSQTINPNELLINENYEAEYKKLCDILEIEYREQQWYLVSYADF